jgi:cardiolipin synthase
MVMGVLALGTLILSLFSGIGDRPDSISQTAGCPVGSHDFLLALSGVLNAPLHRGGTAKLHNNGDEFFPAIFEAMRAAERSINVTVYIWEDGDVSTEFFDILVERAQARVEVRVLVDGFGGLKAPGERIRELRAAGGIWAEFHRPRFGMLTRIHKRTHRRAIVVDGKVGFTGGAAVMDKWRGNARSPEEWRDCMVEVGGRLALSLQSAFAQLWAHVTGELLVGEAFYPIGEHEGGPDVEGQPVRRHLSVISSPSSESHPMRPLYGFSIQSSQKRVYITNPYFVPDRILCSNLIDRAQAGVDVRVIVPSHHIDLKPIRLASQSYFEELLGGGVRIFEYQPTMIHQKLLVADGVWSLVGSVNMDVRSKELNQENALGILDEDFAAEMERTFLEDLSRSREVKLEEWRRRPWWHRIPERFFRLFEEQF